MRADIDALPLTEKTGLPFASVNPGVMHACGHDMHTAIAAGVACELNRVRDRLNCNLVVLFQPAEESSPIGGARPIVESGFLEAQRIDALYGLHNWPSLPVGEIGVKPGAIMAASDRFHIEIIGRTAHAAEPHLGVDAIMIASKIDCALVQDLRHEVDPFDPISVSIGAFLRRDDIILSANTRRWTGRFAPRTREPENICIGGSTKLQKALREPMVVRLRLK